MVKKHWLNGVLMLSWLVCAMSPIFAMAGGDLVARDALVSGSGALASGNSPAVIKVSVAGRDETKQAQLELSISPVTVARDEAYLVVVSQANDLDTGEARRQLGSFSFFPPPREGETRQFYVDLPSISPEMRAKGKFEAELSIALISADPKHPLLSSSVRVVGARIVTG
jgi:hypothetical protein